MEERTTPSADAAATLLFQGGELCVFNVQVIKVNTSIPIERKPFKHNSLIIWPMFSEKLSASISYKS
jgi:hypothetical protein